MRVPISRQPMLVCSANGTLADQPERLARIKQLGNVADSAIAPYSAENLSQFAGAIIMAIVVSAPGSLVGFPALLCLSRGMGTK